MPITTYSLVQTDDEVSRRIFLERLAAGALLGVAGASSQPARAQSQAESHAPNWTTPPVLENPDILVGKRTIGRAAYQARSRLYNG